MFMPALAKASNVQKHIFQIGLARLVRDNKAVAFTGIEPLYASADPNEFILRINAIEI